MKPGDIVFHKATAEPMVVLYTTKDDGGADRSVMVRHAYNGKHGEHGYTEYNFMPHEFETFEERAGRERDMQKFLFALSHEQKGPQAVN